ncbi:MAG: tetratricopeptide repeat protein [Pseudomonadales bacterium]|nr:tetratricopeptide repeat protein [Pseudomonadales bacterium]
MNSTTLDSAPTARVFDATAATFEQDVILRSREVPVLVDFWATWCAPCKALGPILEKLAGEYNGAFLLAKVDIDREQQLAGYFQIRSVPTVLLLAEGRIAGGFPGALPEGQVRRFLAEHGIEPGAAAAPAPVVDAAEALAHARAAVAAAPDKPELKLDLVLALVAMGEHAEAETLLEALPANLGTDPRAARARSRIALARLAAEAPPRAALEQALAADPEDHRARHLLGVRLVLEGAPEVGLEHLLELLRRARGYADGLPRRALVDAFNVVEDEDLVRAVRRRMTALLF